MPIDLGLPAPPPLTMDLSGTTQNQLWTKWRDNLNLYFLAAEIKETKRKKALLLYIGGEELRKIHDTLKDAGESYLAAITVLDDFFETRLNLSVERHKFRILVQENCENMKSYVTRLREAAQNCNFSEYSSDAAIIDQVIEKTTSTKLRRKLMNEDNLTLEKLVKTASIMESTEQQASSIEGRDSETVHTIKKQTFNERRNYEDRGATNSGAYRKNSPQFYKRSEQPYNPRRESNRRQDQGNTDQRRDQTYNNQRRIFRCYGCGLENHRIGSPECPALGTKCGFCGCRNHYESQCKKKLDSESGGTKVKKEDFLKLVEVDSDDDYIFHIGKQAHTDVGIKVEGYHINFLRDSGASVNLVDKATYNELRNHMKVTLHPTRTKIFAYGAKEPIKLEGVFYATVSHEATHHLARIHVASNEQSGCILGRESAIELGLLQMSENINAVAIRNIGIQIKKEFPELFNKLGKLKNTSIKFNIDPSIKPVSQHLRRIPFHVRKKVEAKLDQLIELDIIEEVTEATSWVSPIVAIPKKDDIRLTIDMRQPNRAILRSHYPIPTLDEILQQFNGCKVYSKIDLNNGYHQIVLEEESRELTTFITHKGLYRYKRLVQGANSAFEEYQRCIGNLFTKEEHIANICDDILIAGKSEQEHDENLRTCLNTLRANNLTVNEQKCIWKVSEVTFYGHVISEEGIKPTVSKVAAINAFPSPRSTKEVSSFIGMVTYLARFIPNLSTETAPLRNLLRKEVPWKWGKEEEEAFRRLKELVSSSKVVAHFNQSLDTALIVDAGKVGLGAILVQTQEDNTVKPVSFASKTLTSQECKYSQTEKEALAVIWACEKFHIFLYGKQFDILTDHQPLSVLYTHVGKPSPRILRWGLRLQSYDYRIKYIPGKLNPADMLSINPIPLTEADKNESNETEKYINNLISYSKPVAVSLSEMVKESEEDETIRKVIECVETNQWDSKEECIKPFYQVRNELAQKGGLLLRTERIVIPKKLRKRMLDLSHETHMGIVKSKAMMKEKIWWPGMSQDIERMIKSCIPCLSMGTTTKEPMGFIDFPMSGPWEQVHVDFCGPYPSGEYVLGIIDAATRWPELYTTRITTSEVVIKRLKRSFATHGYPKIIVTDNAPNLISAKVEQFCKENDIIHRRATPYHPQANSEIERFYRTLGKFVKTTHSEGRRWQDEIDNFLLIYRNTPHSTTSVSPAMLLMNRKLRDKILTIKMEESAIMKRVRKINENKKLKSKEYYDNKNSVNYSHIKEGDSVLVRRVGNKNKLSTTFEPTPVEVIARSGPTATILKNGRQTSRNIKDLKKIPQQDAYEDLTLEGEDINIEPVIGAADEERVEENVQQEVQLERQKRNVVPPVWTEDYIME